MCVVKTLLIVFVRRAGDTVVGNFYGKIAQNNGKNHPLKLPITSNYAICGGYVPHFTIHTVIIIIGPQNRSIAWSLFGFWEEKCIKRACYKQTVSTTELISLKWCWCTRVIPWNHWKTSNLSSNCHSPSLFFFLTFINNNLPHQLQLQN